MKTMIANRYNLLHKLGEGGMADVYLAIDTILNREVAIKILRGDLAIDPVAVLRFKREAKAALALNHQNIVQVYDVGEEDGSHYIVMEYIKGITLKQLISKRGALDKQEAVDIMSQLLSAMMMAHKNSVVHRDIKPQNILIKDDGCVKLTDFGIALAQNVAQLTQADSVLGSVHYLAPELARGEAASEQSDIYALGIVFYELLCGDVPYHGDAPVQVALKHLRDDLPSIRDFNPTIPQAIENIIIIATAKNKNNRYETCGAMLKDLESSLDANRAHEERVKFTLEDHADEETIVLMREDSTKAQNKKRKQILSLERILAFSLIAFAAVAVVGIMMLTSTGPFKSKLEDVIIPSVENLSIELATLTMEDAGLRVDPISRYETSTSIDKDKVIGVVQGIGSVVKEGSQVKLIICEGRLYEVDNYVGMDLNAAKKALAKLNVTVKINKESTSEYAPDTVIKQDGLIAGAFIQPHLYNEIRLTIAIPSSVTIDDYVGYSLEEATNILENLGLIVLPIKLDINDLPPLDQESVVSEKIVQQFPLPGSVVTIVGSDPIELYFY